MRGHLLHNRQRVVDRVGRTGPGEHRQIVGRIAGGYDMQGTVPLRCRNALQGRSLGHPWSADLQ